MNFRELVDTLSWEYYNSERFSQERVSLSFEEWLDSLSNSELILWLKRFDDPY